MPVSKPTPVSHAQVVDAIHTITSLAGSIPAQTFPPFSYGKKPGQFPMTPGNSLPAMVVWLFLVTNPDFLYTLDDPTGDQSLVPVDQIAAVANLTTDTVKAILQVYTNRDKTDTNHFLQVASAFQGYSVTAGYPKLNCPGGPQAITELGTSGAAVDPNAV